MNGKIKTPTTIDIAPMVANLPCPAVVVESQNRILTLNSEAGKLLTVQPGELIDQKTLQNHSCWQCTVLSRTPHLLELFTWSPDISCLQSGNDMLALVSDVDIGIWEFEPKTMNCFFSDRFKSLIGHDARQPLHWRQFRELIDDEDQEIFDVFFEDHLAYGVALKFDFRITRQDAVFGQRWFLLHGEIVPQGDRIRGILRESTLEKEAYSMLTKTAQTNDLALEAGNIGIWSGERLVNDDVHWCWDWDHRINEMFGFDRKEQGNFDAWLRRIVAKDRGMSLALLSKSLKSGCEYDSQFRIKTPSGELRYITAKAKATKNQIGEVCRIDGICCDQSEIHVAQAKLKLLNESLEKRVSERTAAFEEAKIAAEKASEAKSAFLAMMSHEIRSPMNAVIGSLDLLATYKQSFEEIDLIDTAKASATALVNILNDILDFSKIEAGKLTLNTDDFSLAAMLDAVIAIFEPNAAGKDIVLRIIEDPDLPPIVQGDELRLQQILFNLIGNAIKFTDPDDGAPGEVELRVECGERNQYVASIRFTVKDNGIGIAPSVQKSLFTPFKQAEDSTSRKYGGTGLGLAICGQLVDMMGGKINLESEPGKGSAFCVELPMWLPTQASTAGEFELFGEYIEVLCWSKNLQENYSNWQAYLEQAGALVAGLGLGQSPWQEKHSNATRLILADTDTVQEAKFRDLLEQKPANVKLVLALSGSKCQRQNLNIHGKQIFLMPEAIESTTRLRLVRSLSRLLGDNGIDSLATQTNDGTTCLQNKTNRLPDSADDANLEDQDILVVEDNEISRHLITKQLKHLGVGCFIAEDGHLGLAEWESGRFKLILTDCHMPNMNGYEMTRCIREKEQQIAVARHIPIVAITGAAMKGDEQLCFDAGMDDFVSKPVQLKDIQRVLETWYG